ncbi:MAG: alpha/beta hydrolase [Solirubrobacteraceae bacterium]
MIPPSAVGLCRKWPATPPAPPPPIEVSAVPTLILSGNEDLREPYEQDLTVAAGYSDAQILRIPDTGHSTVGSDRTGCAQRATIAFLTSGHAPSVCSTPHESQVLPPPPSSLGELHPARSSSTLAGRGATAVAMTIVEVLGQPSLEGGGLHGGSWQLQGTQVKLRRLIDIPGVSLSGSLQLTNATARLTIRGRVHGTIEVRGTALSGRLNGAEVRARLIR